MKSRPVALVTGATRGLGRETALALGEAGYRVVIVGRSTRERPNPVMSGTLEDVEEILRARGAEVLAVAADVSNPESVDAIRRRALERFGQCDVIVSNAAYAIVGPALEIPASRWLTAYKVNVLATVLLCQAFIPGMIERGEGRIAVVSSSASVTQVPSQLPYAVSKIALDRFASGLEFEVGGRGVAFNVLRIDEVIVTEGNRRMLESASEAGASTIAENTAVGRVTPEEWGRAMVWLAEQPTSFTGNVLTLGDLRKLGALPKLAGPERSEPRTL